MNKKNLVISIFLIFMSGSVYGQQAIPETWRLIASLKSNNPELMEKAFNFLGLDRGILGLSKIQILQPCCLGSETPTIISISWEGPFDGYVFLLDANGNILSKEHVGNIKSLTLRPIEKEGNDVLITDSVKGAGTGIVQNEFNIFRINIKKLNNIWNAVSYEKSFPLGLDKDQNYELKGFLQFEDLNNDGTDELIYTIKKAFYSFDIKTQKLLFFKKDKTTKVFKLDKSKYVYVGPLEE